MNVDIYQSSTNPNRFLSVASGTNVETLTLKGEDSKHYSQVKPFRKALSINASDKRIAVDAKDLISKIQSNGYALHGVQLQFTETA